MIDFNAVRLWGISTFNISEGKIISGSASCVWCDDVASTGEFVLVVQEQGRTVPFVLHLKCLPAEVKAAHIMALGVSRVAQVKQNGAPQRA